MNVTFGKASLETIKRLQELCEKKGYHIIFGFDSYHGDSPEKELIEKLQKEEIITGDSYNYNEMVAKFWLELHDDKTKKPFDYLIYTETEYYFEGYHVQGDYGNMHSDTEVDVKSSFNLKDETVHLCEPYRWGVVLGSFANHVAKKLGEPDIMKDISY